jgi:hypothetical protein
VEETLIRRKRRDYENPSKQIFSHKEMISLIDGIWKAVEDIKSNSVVLEESPILSCPSIIPAGWRKLAKKVSKLEADAKPDEVFDTMPTWSHVTLNDAIIRLLYAFDQSDGNICDNILGMYDVADESTDAPFESLIKKAKILINKEGSKLGITKKTMSNLHEILRILTTKVCVTTDGGAVLFRKLGSIQHSCTPNCMFIPRGDNKAQLISIRDIRAGESINCSHIPTNCLRASCEIRQSWLRGIAGSRCRSSCCASGYDMRRRVICAKCHPMASRNLLSGCDQSELCFAARNNESGRWKGFRCGVDMDESEAMDIQKENHLIKKISILNEAEVDIARLFQYTRSAVSEAIIVFGKGHFTYQQLLLLECGLALHSLCTNTTGSEGQLFVTWTKMLVDIVNYSIETELPFAGMDELVRILVAPETLQMSLKIMTSTRKDDTVAVDALTTFASFVEQSCNCLVLIEGSDSVHSQDALKLKNWWTKKYNNWRLTPDPVVIEEKSFVSTNADETETVAPATPQMLSPFLSSSLLKYTTPIAIASSVAVVGILIYSLKTRRN